MISRLLILSCSVLLLGALASCGDTDNTIKPNAIKPFAPTAKITTQWKRSAGDGLGTRYLNLGLSDSKGVLYAVDYVGHVTALSQKTGTVKWEVNINQPISAPAVSNGNAVAVPTLNGELFILSAQTGAVQTIIKLPTVSLAKAAIRQGRVFVHCHNGDVWAYMLASGHPLWHYSNTLEELTLTSDSAPVVSGDSVIVGLDAGSVVSLDSMTGKVNWLRPIALSQGSSDISRIVEVNASPLVYGDKIFAASYQGNLVALNFSDGHILWQSPVSIYRPLAIAHNKVFAVDDDSDVLAFAIDTGKVVWKQDALYGRTLSGAAVVGSAVMVGDYQGYVHALSIQTGALIARDYLGGLGVFSQPLALNGTAYTLTNSGRVYALVPKR